MTEISPTLCLFIAYFGEGGKRCSRSVEVRQERLNISLTERYLYSPIEILSTIEESQMDTEGEKFQAAQRKKRGR